MGNCTSSAHYTRKGSGSLKWPTTAKLVHIDGRLQEFKQPIKASHILSQNPNSFLCSSESMYVDCQLPRVADDEDLHMDQIYFLLPLSMSQVPLSLQDLCALAVKASSALAQSGYTLIKTMSYLERDSSNIPAGYQRCCNIPVGFDIVGKNSPVTGRGHRLM